MHLRLLCSGDSGPGPMDTSADDPNLRTLASHPLDLDLSTGHTFLNADLELDADALLSQLLADAPLQTASQACPADHMQAGPGRCVKCAYQYIRVRHLHAVPALLGGAA